MLILTAYPLMVYLRARPSVVTRLDQVAVEAPAGPAVFWATICAEGGGFPAPMNEPVHAPRIEPRWPVALAVLAVFFLLAFLPGRVRLLPAWAVYVFGIAVLAPMGGVTLAAAKARWLRVERTITLLFVLIGGTLTLATLAYLIRAMVSRPEDISGLQLLSSSIAVWVTNVLVFSLLYWQVDHGGPEARAGDANRNSEWLFPEVRAAGNLPPDWRPRFIDYLFLGFSTSTAFSPTHALPLTSRAKMLMMLQSAISLSTLVVVASRAINILGS